MAARTAQSSVSQLWADTLTWVGGVVPLSGDTFTIPLSFTLSSPQQNDQECVLEIGGQRLFIEFKSVGSGGYAEVGPVMLEGEMDKVSPHRGVSS